MFTLFYFLVLEQILQGLYNLWDGLVWLRLAQRRAAGHSGFYAPRVALFCPVKGAEPGLEQNIAALASFDYPEYEIFFAMASADDPARKIIERTTAGSKRNINIVIAGRPADCGEKVNNLRAAGRSAWPQVAGASRRAAGGCKSRRGDRVPLAVPAERRTLERAGVGLERPDRDLSRGARPEFLLGRRDGDPP